MKTLWFRAAIMTASFFMVVLAIRNLKNSNTIEKGLRAITYTPASDRHLTWCETRVNEIEIPGQFRMYQDGLKWFREAANGTTVELGFVPVEKWFSEYCKMSVDGITENFEAAAESAANAARVIARVGFIKGEDKAFTTVDANLYSWGKWSFRSQAFEKALKELADLPAIGGSERGKAPGH